MKLDTWKSTVSGRSFLSVPTGVEPWSVVERSELPWHMRQIRLFRRGLEVAETPLVSDADAVIAQIGDRGFALHVGSLHPAQAATSSIPAARDATTAADLAER